MALLELALPCACRRGGSGPKQALQVSCQARARCCIACIESAINPSAQLSFSGIITLSPTPLIQGLAHLTRQRVCGCIAPTKGHWRLVRGYRLCTLAWHWGCTSLRPARRSLEWIVFNWSRPLPCVRGVRVPYPRNRELKRVVPGLCQNPLYWCHAAVSDGICRDCNCTSLAKQCDHRK